ncbi:D-isomer specific 2-hydroxyacid dehydrogenase-protein, partial [Trypanosoma conorhini]
MHSHQHKEEKTAIHLHILHRTQATKMSLRLCVCTASANGEYYMEMFNKHLSSFFKSITLGSKVSDFKEVKESKDHIILYVDGPAGYDGIKDLVRRLPPAEGAE